MCELLDVASGVRPETKPLLISFLFLICFFLWKQIKNKKEIEDLELEIIGRGAQFLPNIFENGFSAKAFSFQYLLILFPG